MTALRLVLQKAVRAKHLASNPFSDLDAVLPRRTDETTIDPFTGDEVRRLLEAAETIDSAWRTLLEVWARTGARAGEITALQAQDVDTARGVVLIRRTWTRKRLGTPKTGVERAVGVCHPIVEETAAWQPGSTAESREVLARLGRLPVRLDPRAYLFGEGQRPLDSAVIHRLWKRTIQRAQVRYRAPEQFRHTFASVMLSRNAPPLYVQQQGGWRSASVLFRVYARWMPQEPSLMADSAPQRTERPEPTAPQARPTPGSAIG